jgi:hypothetical protein
MAPPRTASKSKVKTRPAEGKSAEARPAEGLSTAKPLSKGKAKGTPENGTPVSATGQGSDRPAAGATTVEALSSRPGGAGAGAAGAASASAPAAGSSQAERPAQAPAGARLSDEERQRRIAEAAYRKAQERGFSGDRQLEDWLEAERELDHGGGRRG